jgi:hypothetical protein
MRCSRVAFRLTIHVLSRYMLRTIDSKSFQHHRYSDCQISCSAHGRPPLMLSFAPPTYRLIENCRKQPCAEGESQYRSDFHPFTPGERTRPCHGIGCAEAIDYNDAGETVTHPPRRPKSEPRIAAGLGGAIAPGDQGEPVNPPLMTASTSSIDTPRRAVDLLIEKLRLLVVDGRCRQ